MIAFRTASELGVAVRGPDVWGTDEILTPAALEFVADLSGRFEPMRQTLLARRSERQATFDSGTLPRFLPETSDMREGEWRIDPLPPALLDRRVEITGPVERKMMINALNSGAQVFMADFEDANSPTWENIIGGQLNLIDAIDGTIDFTSPDGKMYRLNPDPAVIMVRPRGWHLIDKHVLVNDQPMSASLLDFGLFFFHNAQRLMDKGAAPYFYLPKLESHLEARLWNEIFIHAQDALHVARGTIKATVLIETIVAAYEMDEILYELKEHSAGLNAGRWDYLFSIIKKFRWRPDFTLPDRAQLAMTVPFMRAYTELLVKTCHRRQAPAIGGMAAVIPSRRDPEINEGALAKVREDKERESNDGFDGTWVAHPDLVPVACAAFAAVLGSRTNQIQRQRNDVEVNAAQLLDVRVPGGLISEAGLRGNVAVTLRYLVSWLSGVGAAAIDNLMEDVATAEIARSQIWQWVHRGAKMSDGRDITHELVCQIQREELGKLHMIAGDDVLAQNRLSDATEIFKTVALGNQFVEFLTLPAYDYLS
ncbi:MAG: malate synthase A [Candidatus Eremiobacter antarcticus]|nr:malate synthase A [Candidatus Eremiobacteraeota bacterium]MBC5824283.1 malate synthase A [Candidatus Eremiobacteraeota bacterium]PZR62117.1 MAG: malate synthase A [Candidatus Eremiobacter sp. RRmetagenome_bin22]